MSSSPPGIYDGASRTIRESIAGLWENGVSEQDGIQEFAAFVSD